MRLCTELSKSGTEPFEPKYHVKTINFAAPPHPGTGLQPLDLISARRGKAPRSRALPLVEHGHLPIEAKGHGCRGRTIATSATYSTARWYVASIICMVGRAIAHGR